MPEIRIRYEDDSDRMPHGAVNAVFQTAAELLQVTEVGWTRDDDLDEETVTVRPDMSGIDDAWRRVTGSGFQPHGRLGRGV